MSWRDYQESTFKMKPNYLAVYLVNHQSFQKVIDLGCGSGNDTVYFARKGKSVLAIDRELSENYITQRLSIKELKRVFLQQSFFETVLLPQTDCVYSVFSLSFCDPCSFIILWNKIVQSLKSGGLLAANLFGERDSHSNNSKVSTFTKEEILKLLVDFEIVKWKEQEYNRKSDSLHFHYYDFVAVKK